MTSSSPAIRPSPPAAGILFGFLGVLLAAPLTVVVYVLVQGVYVKTLLGKDIRIAGAD